MPLIPPSVIAHSTVLTLITLRFQTQQGRGLGAIAVELLIGLLVAFHPLDGLLEAGERLRLVTEPPVGHGLEEEIVTFGGAVAGGQALVQGSDGLGVLACAILDDAKRIEVPFMLDFGQLVILALAS